jgi:hypothetical protein
MRSWIIPSILILMSSVLQAQDIKEIVKDVRVDIQYKYNCYIVSPFANQNEEDCKILEKTLDTTFSKIKDGIWVGPNWTIQKQNTQMGSYYLFIKKEN